MNNNSELLDLVPSKLNLNQSPSPEINNISDSSFINIAKELNKIKSSTKNWSFVQSQIQSTMKQSHIEDVQVYSKKMIQFC